VCEKEEQGQFGGWSTAKGAVKTKVQIQKSKKIKRAGGEKPGQERGAKHWAVGWMKVKSNMNCKR